jgi:hypothetical protein
MSKDADRDSVASHCYALIPYKPPDYFTAIEAAIFEHGTHAERLSVLNAVCARSLGVPAFVIESAETNYSSAKVDAGNWAKAGPNGPYA